MGDPFGPGSRASHRAPPSRVSALSGFDPPSSRAPRRPHAGSQAAWWCGRSGDAWAFAFADLWERWTVPEGSTLKGSLAELAPGDSLKT